MMLIALALELAIAAQGGVDDDWARVNSCERLGAFRTRWGERSRYSRYYEQVSRRLGCIRPSVRQPRTVEPVRPPPPRAAMPTVTLDASGRGDVTSLSAALDRVATGGTIVVRPGTYWAGMRFERSVTLRGIPDAAGNLPTLRTASQRIPVIHVYGGSVNLDSLILRAEGPQSNALYILGGNVTARGVQFAWTGTRNADNQVAEYAAVYAGVNAIVTIERSRIGPGSSQALAVSGRANVSITDSLISNSGGAYGVFLAGGSLTLRQVNISNAGMALVGNNSGHASLSLVLIHSVNYREKYPIYVTNNVTIRVQQSIVCIPSGYQWAIARENARITASGVYNANGAVLEQASTTSGLPEQARSFCAGRF